MGSWPKITCNVRRYVHVAVAWGWHEFLPSCWMWRFFRFTKSSRDAKTMTPGGSAPAFSRGQPASYYGILFLSVSECWPKGNCIYRPVMASYFINSWVFKYCLILSSNLGSSPFAKFFGKPKPILSVAQVSG